MRCGVFRYVVNVSANLTIGMSAASYNQRRLRNCHERTGDHANHPFLVPDDKNQGFVYLAAEQAARIAVASIPDVEAT